MRPSSRFLRPDPEALKRGPFGRPQQVRRRKGNHPPLPRLFFGAAALLACAALAHAAWGFVHSDRAFAIRRLQVVGIAQHEPAEVRAALEGLTGTNLVALDPAQVGARLATFGWVEGYLCRKNLPDTLIVEVRERSELCAVQTSSGLFCVDGKGHSWRASSYQRPLFQLAPGADPADPGLQTLVASLIQAGLTREVRTLGRAGGGGYTLETQDQWTLTVSPEGVAEQWSKYTRARAWASAYLPERKALDLRWSGRAVLLPPPVPVEGGEANGQV